MQDDLGIKILLGIIFGLIISYFILLFRVNSIDDEFNKQCEQLGGAYIQDNRNDFYCVALIKMENKK